MSPLRRLLLMMFCAAALLVGANFAANRWALGSASDGVEVNRPSNVLVLSKNPKNLPAAPAGRALWLMGNSHTYALPGLKRGEPLRGDPGVTLIDELARQAIAKGQSSPDSTFWRIANPNLLPTEMWVRAEWLLRHGFKPNVVVLGITFRNVARDTALRHDILEVFDDPDFVAWLRGDLAGSAEASRLEPLIDASQRQVAHEREQERQRSTADRLDEWLAEPVGRVLPLVGKSAELRASLYRGFSYGLVRLAGGSASELKYDVVPQDLAINQAALAALLRRLEGVGATPLVYLAPERNDLPALMRGNEHEQFVNWLTEVVAKHHGTLVDARDAVPNEYWGWEESTPDRSHFTEPGHRLLAQRLVERAAQALSRLGPP